MSYAVRADLVKRYGEQEIALLEDPDNEGTNSTSVSRDALKDAEDLANSYISVRYTLPLPSVPAPLARATCDIARYSLYKDRPPEEVAKRYDQSIKWLEQLAAGKVQLTFDPALTPAQLDEIVSPVTPVAAIAPGSVFGDAVFDKMPTLDRAGSWGWGR